MRLETERLTLRELTLDDLDFVAEMMADPEVMRYYPRRLDRAGSLEWLDRQRDRYALTGVGLWLVSDRALQRTVGQVGLIRRGIEGVEHTEVGYLIHRPYWRRGYAKEAASACRDFAFHTLGVRQLIALIRPENLPSQAVARSLGLETDGRIVQHAGLAHLVFTQDAPGMAGG